MLCVGGIVTPQGDKGGITRVGVDADVYRTNALLLVADAHEGSTSASLWRRFSPMSRRTRTPLTLARDMGIMPRSTPAVLYEPVGALHGIIDASDGEDRRGSEKDNLVLPDANISKITAMASSTLFTVVPAGTPSEY